MSDDRTISIHGVVLSQKQAVAVRTMFRSPEWMEVCRMMQSMSASKTGATLGDNKCRDAIEFGRAQGYFQALSEVASLADIIEEELT